VKLGVLALARATFDVPYAEATAEAAFAVLDGLDVETVGSRAAVFDADGAGEAAAVLAGEGIDRLLVLQLTFSDATMIEEVAKNTSVPIALWAFPEPRTGGRLRLNSFCGTNLAAHSLRRMGSRYTYLLCATDAPDAAEALAGLLEAPPVTAGEHAVPGTDGMDTAAVDRAEAVRSRLAVTTIGVIGDHPDGFLPSEYDADALAALTGVTVERIELDELFEAARGVPDDALGPARRRAARLDGIDDVDQDELANSLRLYPALASAARELGLAGLSVRCWPEAFTEYGGAVCGPAAMMNDDLLPTACEADVYGNVTGLVLQWLTGEPVLVADLVDIDPADGTGVLWHCGKAPTAMADPEAVRTATVHSNRKKPLLNEYPLKPGRVTLARLSQAGGRHTLLVGGGEMVRAPLAFSGTAGVVRFDSPASDVVDTVMVEGLEHHYGIGYGDVRAELHALAAGWGIPVVEL
jgi:L-fucose isomerase-like protein